MIKAICTMALGLMLAACGGKTAEASNDTTAVVVDTVAVKADTLAIGGAGQSEAGTVPTEQKK